MNKFNQMLLLAALFSLQSVSSQMIKRESASNKISQLLKVRQLESVSGKLAIVNIASKAKKLPVVSINLAAQVDELEMLCPFLDNVTSYLRLDGARKNDEIVGLKWETRNIFRNWGFYVERSLGDSNHFETVHFVWATSESGVKEKYQLPDNNNYDEPSFYRLRLLIMGDHYVYSNIAEVKGYSKELFTLFPNPASNNLKMNLTTKAAGMATITLYDVNGKTVQHNSTSVMKGQNVKSIDISKLPPGTFVVKMLMPDHSSRTGKFIKR